MESCVQVKIKKQVETGFKGFKMILMNRKCSSWGNKFKSSFDCNAVEKIMIEINSFTILIIFRILIFTF